MANSVETNITNALAHVSASQQSAYLELADSLQAVTSSSGYGQLMRLLGDSPFSSYSVRYNEFGSGLGDLGWIIREDDPWELQVEKNEELDEQLRSLTQAAQDKVRDILGDLKNKALGVFSELGMTLYSDADAAEIIALNYSFFDLRFSTLAAEIAAAEHASLRERRKLMSALAERGHQYMPGYAVDALISERMESNDKVINQYTYALRGRLDNELALWKAKASALIDLLKDMVQAKQRFLVASQQYASSIKNGIQFAADSTFYDALAQLEYDALKVQEMREDTGIKNDLLSAYQGVLSVQSRVDDMRREFESMLATDGESSRKYDMAQYHTVQKATVEAGVNALQWLGKIAAAAETAMTSVVSASQTSFG